MACHTLLLALLSQLNICAASTDSLHCAGEQAASNSISMTASKVRERISGWYRAFYGP